MNIKNILYIVFIYNIASAHAIETSDCSYDQLIQQDRVYWCLMHKYQQSVIALKKEEINAQKRLEIFDNNEGKKRGLNEDGTLAYDSNIHLARITFPELHRYFILYREKQCGYSSLSIGALSGYGIPISSLYCKTEMNISQIKWLNDYI